MLNVISLMTSQVGSKAKFLIFSHCWLRRAKQPYEIEIKPGNDMGRVWDTSKYWPYDFCDLVSNEGHRRSKKFKLKILSLSGVIHVF